MGRRYSVCAQKQVIPLPWIWFLDRGSNESAEAELDLALAAVKSPIERSARRGEIDDRMAKASRGELASYDRSSFEPVQLDPLLWEHKWHFEDAEWRLYHGEPIGLRSLVALLFHDKTRDGRRWRSKQDRQMRKASGRLTRGMLFKWRQ